MIPNTLPSALILRVMSAKEVWAPAPIWPPVPLTAGHYRLVATFTPMNGRVPRNGQARLVTSAEFDVA